MSRFSSPSGSTPGGDASISSRASSKAPPPYIRKKETGRDSVLTVCSAKSTQRILARISHRVAGQAHEGPAITSLRLLAVLNVL